MRAASRSRPPRRRQSSYKASATSGAGGSSVGVAGSIAVNVVVSNTTSDIDGTSPVALNGADLTFTATSNLDNQALATAKQSTDGSASGVGASVGVNVVNDTTSAGLPNGAVLNGTKNLTVTSTSTDSMTTTANGGASAGSGSLALSAQVGSNDLERHDERHDRDRPRPDDHRHADRSCDADGEDDNEGDAARRRAARRGSASRSRSSWPITLSTHSSSATSRPAVR